MSTIQNQKSQSGAKAIALLMLIQMALGLLLNFYFLKPVLRYDGSAPIETITFILGCATLVALIISAINIAFGLLLPQEKIKEHWQTFVFLIVFAAAGLTICAYEYARLAESITFLSSNFANEHNIELLDTILASGRNEAHFLSIFISSSSLAIFYMLLLRAELINKWVAYFALIATLLQLVAIGHTFFQMSIPRLLQLPIAISQLGVPIYLLFAGFKQSTSPASKQPQPANELKG